ncbi:maleylpyruvate isomerase family mycothiol-dependent enzyme [Spirillospora albida]|uniref:maleylpyruvate isomerase family mycothiol-dependent enzyme n=1 Tax=Spirillospora albida TaxID=58123 RepID=UPI0004BEEE1E|nr:maleylpyruvate isomerase family mycothiol-dependent enzyme [Spirillospora albida]
MSEDAHPDATGALAAWAVDACPPDEARAIGEHLAWCAGCAGEAARLRETAGLLATAVAERPPPDVRDAVLAAARRRRRPGAGIVPAGGLAQVYAEQVAHMDRLLESLTPAHWRTPLPRYASVRDLVAHLTANDAAFAADLGLPAGGPSPAGRAAPAAGRDALAAGGSASPARGGDDVRTAWRTRARAVVRGVSGDARVLELEASLAGAEGVRAPARDVLVQRAFETWTHADDIRAVVGRPPEPPPGEHLRLVVELGTGLLPKALRRPYPGRAAELRLTGPGAGTWRVPLAPGEAPGVPDVTVTARTEDFCRLIAGRIPPARFPHDAEGDAEVVAAVLYAASTLGCD